MIPVRATRRTLGLLTTGQAVAAACILTQTVVLARILGADEFGRYAIVVATGGLVAMMIDVRSWETVMRFTHRFRERERPDLAWATVRLLLAADIAVALVIAVGLTLATRVPIGRNLMADADPTLMLLYGGTILAASPFGTAFGLTYAAQRQPQAAAVEALGAAGQLAGTAVAALLTRDAGWVIVALTGGILLRTAAAWAVGMRSARSLGLLDGPRAPLGALRPYLSEFARFWVSTTGFAVVKALGGNADTVAVGHVGALPDVARYRVSAGVARMTGVIVQPLYQLAYPRFSAAAAAGRHVEARQLLRRATSVTAIVAAVVVGGLALWGGYAIEAVFGTEFSGLGMVAAIIALGVGISATGQFAHAYLLAGGALKAINISNAVYAGSLVASLIILTPDGGAIGAAQATVLAATCRQIPLLIALRRAPRVAA